MSSRPALDGLLRISDLRFRISDSFGRREDSTMRPIRVVLADDHHLVRAGFRALIQNFAGFEVVAEASNGREAVQQVEKFQPDLVLMDIMMPELDGLGAAVQVAAVSPETRVVILSMNSGADSVLSAMRAGAAGYLLKDVSPAELELALRSVARGQTYLCPAASRHVIAGYVQRHRRRGKSPGTFDPAATRGAAIDRPGQHDQRDCPQAENQRQDGRDPSLAIDAGTGHPRHRRLGAIRDPLGFDLLRRVGNGLESPSGLTVVFPAFVSQVFPRRVSGFLPICANRAATVGYTGIVYVGLSSLIRSGWNAWRTPRQAEEADLRMPWQRVRQRWEGNLRW